VLWIIEGHILSNQEVEYLASLPSIEPRVKVVLERGGDRFFPLDTSGENTFS
jgi:NAD(P)H-quinone oxidoreductase subunit N